MPHFTKLRVYQQARKNLKQISQICKHTRGFGDIQNQIQRAAISVVSNIAEGTGNNTDKQTVHFLGIARGSNNEVLTQLQILHDIGACPINDDLIEDINYTGKMLTKMIQCLR